MRQVNSQIEEVHRARYEGRGMGLSCHPPSTPRVQKPEAL